MNKKTIYLLRHCSTTDTEQGINGAQTDIFLSEKGKEQAVTLIPILKKFVFDLIVVSPLHRTIESINPYLDTLATRPVISIEPLTIERNLGDLTNSVKGDGKIASHRQISGLSRVEWIPPSGESIVDVSERARKFLNLLQNKLERDILICGHQVFLRCLELLILEKPLNDENFYDGNPAMLEVGEIRVYEI